MLTLAGLPFRQEPHIRPPAPAPLSERPASFAASLLACALAGSVALAGPVAAQTLDRAAQAGPPLSVAGLIVGGPCAPIPDGERGNSAASGVDPVSAIRFKCGGQVIALRVEAFPPRASLSQIMQERRRFAAELDGDTDTSPLRSGGVTWELIQREMPPGAAATALWIDGRPARGGFSTRLLQARNSLFGSEQAPVLAVLTPEIDWRSAGPSGRAHARSLVQAFLDSQPDLPRQLATLSTLSGAPSNGAER